LLRRCGRLTAKLRRLQGGLAPRCFPRLLHRCAASADRLLGNRRRRADPLQCREGISPLLQVGLPLGASAAGTIAWRIRGRVGTLLALRTNTKRNSKRSVKDRWCDAGFRLTCAAPLPGSLCRGVQPGTWQIQRGLFGSCLGQKDAPLAWVGLRLTCPSPGLFYWHGSPGRSHVARDHACG
jgi:hypothetical protein